MLQHDRDADAGLLGEWLATQGFGIREIRAPETSTLPDPRDFSLVVVLGSSHCAGESLPWIDREVGLVREAHETGTPVFGICFGGQLLARALGGRVLANQVAEIGWTRIDTRDPGVISPGPWFEWHFDLLEPPAQAEILATSSCGVEAFRLGSSIGVQFHPEVDREIIETWATADPGDLDLAGTDLPALLDPTVEDPPQNRAAVLFQAIWESLGPSA